MQGSDSIVTVEIVDCNAQLTLPTSPSRLAKKSPTNVVLEETTEDSFTAVLYMA